MGLPPWRLLLPLALLLLPLPRGGAPSGPFAALSPPLTVPAAGGLRRLVACVASELPPGAPAAALWIGAGGRPLRALARSKARGGTAATVAMLPHDDDAAGRPLACHVGTDPAAPWRSSEPLDADGDHGSPPPPPAELCAGPAECAAGPGACAALALLVAAARLLLLKVLLFDALLTALLLA